MTDPVSPGQNYIIQKDLICNCSEQTRSQQRAPESRRSSDPKEKAVTKSYISCESSNNIVPETHGIVAISNNRLCGFRAGKSQSTTQGLKQ